MKGLFISAAMFAAIAGTAFAQASDTGSTAPAGAPMTTPDTAPSAAAPGATPDSVPNAGAPMAAPNNASDTSAEVNPDSDYPICKTRSQDHCREASRTSRAHMARHHAMAKAMAPASSGGAS